MTKLFKVVALTIGSIIALAGTYFFVVRKLDNSAMTATGFYAVDSKPRQPLLLASTFIDGERFYIKLRTAKGDTALAFGDTGGGISMALPSLINKFNLRSKVHTALLKGVMPMHYILFKDVVSGADIPGPIPMRDRILRHFVSMIDEPFLFVPPVDEELRFFIQTMDGDAFLGQNFFMGRSWTFDYINRKVWVNTPIPPADKGHAGVLPLSFKKNNRGENIYGHGRMYIEVDGELIEVLFDTGATIVLSKNGQQQFNTNKKTIGGSFIASSIFNKWRKDHPDWKYYPKVDDVRDVIEVPKIKIGGYEAGPVLFSNRPDKEWSQNMIQSMDSVVKGAIGGSALKYFKVCVDYNSGLIQFTQ